jgi:hypothetical protein
VEAALFHPVSFWSKLGVRPEKNLPQRHKDTEGHKEMLFSFGGKAAKTKINSWCFFVSLCLGGENFNDEPRPRRDAPP